MPDRIACHTSQVGFGLFLPMLPRPGGLGSGWGGGEAELCKRTVPRSRSISRPVKHSGVEKVAGSAAMYGARCDAEPRALSTIKCSITISLRRREGVSRANRDRRFRGRGHKGMYECGLPGVSA